MRTYKQLIKFQVGEPGTSSGRNCCAFSAMATFKYEAGGNMVVEAEGFTGRGTTAYKAALDWCRARLGYDEHNAESRVSNGQSEWR